jgi:hypothetical protein
MGLYLCVFDDDEELEGVEVGSYEDWNTFVQAVVDAAEGGNRGSRFPILSLHSDCDGQWTPTECAELERDLDEIARSLQTRPPAPVPAGWKGEIVKRLGLRFTNLGDCFFDVDGENLIDRLRCLVRVAVGAEKPVLFQ